MERGSQGEKAGAVRKQRDREMKGKDGAAARESTEVIRIVEESTSAEEEEEEEEGGASWLYSFFTPEKGKDDDTRRFRCRKCHTVVMLRPSTSGLRAHLMSHKDNGDLWKSIRMTPRKERTRTTAEQLLRQCGQLRLQLSFACMKDEQLRQLERELHLCLAYVENGFSWYSLESKTLKAFLSKHAGLTIGESAMRQRVFPLLAEHVYREIRKELKGSGPVNLTADGWTRADLRLSSLTVAFMDEEMRLHAFPISAGMLYDGRAASALWSHWSEVS